MSPVELRKPEGAQDVEHPGVRDIRVSQFFAALGF